MLFAGHLKHLPLCKNDPAGHLGVFEGAGGAAFESSDDAFYLEVSVVLLDSLVYYAVGFLSGYDIGYSCLVGSNSLVGYG